MQIESAPVVPLQMYSRSDDRFSARKGWPFVYFHGELETFVGGLSPDGIELSPPDLVAAEKERDDTPDGAHDVEVYGKPARLFLWSCGLRDFIILAPEAPGAPAVEEVRLGLAIHKKVYRTGLVVLASDARSVDYAEKMMAKRSESL